MATYIDAEVADGSYAKKDYETIYSLSGNNGRVDYIGGKLVSLVSSPTHSVNGYAFNGTSQYIDSNFNPATDGTNYVRNDAMFEVFIKETSTDDTNARAFWGHRDGGSFRSQLIRTTTVGGGNYPINSGSATNFTHSHSRESLYGSVRTASGAEALYKDGVLIDSNASSSLEIVSNNIYIGARNNNGTADQFSDATISSVMASAGVGFDYVSHNTNLRTLLATLGTI
jgi:hypothetical protein